MNQVTNLDLPANLEFSASDEAMMDIYLDATKRVLEDVDRSLRRMEKRDVEIQQAISQLFASLNRRQ